MDFFRFSTELSLFLSTEEDVADDQEGIEDEPADELSGLDARDYYIPIPDAHRAVICSVCIVLPLVLNALVLKHYCAVRSASRPYVLALVALDLISVLFIVVPRLIMIYLQNRVAFLVLDWISYLFTVTTFGNYLYASFYLAVDRCFAVWLPHKVHLISQKMKGVKIGVVMVNVSVGCMYVLLQFCFGFASTAAGVFRVLAWLFVAVQLFGSVFLYVVIVVMLLKAARKLQGSKHTG